MSMTLDQQQEMVKMVYEMERVIANISMHHRVAMVFVEALRQKMCLTKAEAEDVLDKFARENTQVIRDELDLEYKDGQFMPTGVSSASIDPERN